MIYLDNCRAIGKILTILSFLKKLNQLTEKTSFNAYKIINKTLMVLIKLKK